MAFQSAPGYNQLQSGVWSPVIYSQNVQKEFRKKSVALDIVNSDYMGELSSFGDTVTIIKEPIVH